jgi:hypothetical protein
MSYPEFLVGRDEDLASLFSIAYSIQAVDELSLDQSNLSVIFIGDESLASKLIGWGIVRRLVLRGNQAVLLVKDGSDLILPE